MLTFNPFIALTQEYSVRNHQGSGWKADFSKQLFSPYHPTTAPVIKLLNLVNHQIFKQFVFLMISPMAPLTVRLL